MPGFEHRQKENPNLLGLVFFPKDLEAEQSLGFPLETTVKQTDNLFLLPPVHVLSARLVSCLRVSPHAF